MGKFLNEFKQFAMRGNVLDMAVGVIIGGAFGKIVSSVVDDIIMPPIGWLIGGVNFSDLKVTLTSVFLLIKVVNKVTAKKEEEKPAETPKAPEPTQEEKLLAEIRDLLKEQKG